MTAIVVRADARRLPIPDASVDLVATSPPYFAQRDYRDGDASLVGQIGAKATPAEYVAALLECTRGWMRVLKPEGSLWINLGDVYSTSQRGPDGSSSSLTNGQQQRPGRGRVNAVPRKSLHGLPWRYALGCIDDLGLILRAEVIWSKVNGLPESVQDRVRRSHEQWFHLVKQPRYYSAVDEIRLPASGYLRPNGAARAAAPGQKRRTMADTCNPLGALPGSVWEMATQPLIAPAELELRHYAAFPPALVRRIVLGWSPPGICTACGEGRRPNASRGRTPDRPGRVQGRAYDALLGGHGADGRAGSRYTSRIGITGYACACPTPDAPTRPAIVVDPFGGTGTTALVASVHGRVGISCDLSHDYGRLARWRTTAPGERARALGVPKPPPVSDDQGSLFDGLDGVVA